MKGVTFITREMHENRNVHEICVVIGHCSGCPVYEVVVGNPLRPLEILSLFFFCAWLVDKLYVLDTFFIFLCGMASVLHREAASVVKYCNIYIAQESHKRNTVVSEAQKSVVSPARKWWTLGVIRALRIAGSFVCG